MASVRFVVWIYLQLTQMSRLYVYYSCDHAQKMLLHATLELRAEWERLSVLACSLLLEYARDWLWKGTRILISFLHR